GVLTGDSDARLRYTVRGYAKHTVIRYRYKLSGWPYNVPFVDFNRIPGGNAPLLRLLHLWHSGALCFMRITKRDLHHAEHRPRRVHPNYHAVA
ncbi:hypothetical protein C8Q77DRAFT_1067863, partial [Trametes polyzona]